MEKLKRLRGGQLLRYKDVVERHIKATHITVDHWETLAQYRPSGGRPITKEKATLKTRYHINTNMITVTAMAFLMLLPPIIFCVNCGRSFTSQIGLFSHQRAKHVTDETLH